MRTSRWIAGALALFFLAWGGVRIVLASGWIRGPYTHLGRDLAWLIGAPENAYNFDVVVPGQVYRSARPDEAFLRRTEERFGITRVVSLSGPSPVHELARGMGMQVETYQWAVATPPPADELEKVVSMMSSGPPTLFHCASGSDRTGYAIASYRVLRDGWSYSAAVKEMKRYWHRPEKYPAVHSWLQEWLGSTSPPAD